MRIWILHVYLSKYYIWWLLNWNFSIWNISIYWKFEKKVETCICVLIFICRHFENLVNVWNIRFTTISIALSKSWKVLFVGKQFGGWVGVGVGVFQTELGNQSQSNQIVVIHLIIVIHIQGIVTFFSLFHSQVIFKSFSKEKAIFWLTMSIIHLFFTKYE